MRSTVDSSESGRLHAGRLFVAGGESGFGALPVARANGVSHFEPVLFGAVVSGQSGLMALDGWTTEQMVAKKSIALHVFWPNAD